MPRTLYVGNDEEFESERACTRSDSEPALGPAAVQTDILQQLAVQSVRQVWWRLSVQPPQRLVVRVAPEPSVGGGQTDVVVGNLRVTEQPGQESRMDRHDVLHLLGVALCARCTNHAAREAGDVRSRTLKRTDACGFPEKTESRGVMEAAKKMR